MAAILATILAVPFGALFLLAVLEAASIVGSEFSTDLVGAALELSSEQVDDTCDALARKLSFIRAEVDGRYAFTHALVQEVCAERSSKARRQRWHRLVAQALERDPRVSEASHLLARHFEAASEPMRAISAYISAGRHAARRYATSDSVALSARALNLVPRLPEVRVPRIPARQGARARPSRLRALGRG